MIESSVGSLTIVDANNTSTAYFWKGEKLKNIISSMTISTPIQRKVSFRLVDPVKVVPTLSVEEITRLNGIYADMKAADIGIIKTNANGI